jgi:hypothetical protein
MTIKKNGGSTPYNLVLYYYSNITCSWLTEVDFDLIFIDTF